MKYCRDLCLAGDYDVVVCGSGPAGFCAAVQAARLGLRTAVLEKNGMAGGTLTSGGNDEIALFYAEGKQIIRGIGWEFVEKLASAGWAEIPDFINETWFVNLGVRVNIPMAATFMDEMLLEAGADIFYYQPAVDVIMKQEPEPQLRTIESIVISTKGGLKAVTGKVFIDCSGDGDVAVWAGADYEISDNLQPATYRFFETGYEKERVSANSISQSGYRAFAEGKLNRGDIWPEGAPNYHRIVREHGNNINHLYNVNGADSVSLTKAVIEARQGIKRVCEWLRSDVDGMEEAYPIALAETIGIRESRRIIGETYVTAEDYAAAIVYPDAISYAFYPLDLHTEHGVHRIDLKENKVPTIPFGALLPKKIKNLMVAGRCLSSDQMSNAALRVKAPCMAMGQAAGVAAFLAISKNLTLREIKINELKRLLIKYGAIVP